MSAVDDAAAVLGARGRRNVLLGPMTTYRVGGAASLLVEPAGPDDLALVAEAVAAGGPDLAVLVVGKGSNLLVSDAGFRGLAVVLGPAFAGIAVHGETVVAGGAVSLPVLARRTAAAGLTGLEWAVGVPGSVGGAVRMNAGGHGSDVRATIRRARLFDLRTGSALDASAEALALDYRRSAVAVHQIVLEAEFALQCGDRAASEATIDEIVRWRRANQPGGQNAGSVFTNPEGKSAGRLVDAAGCKGLRVGSAAVSSKHANFIQADDGGRADDVEALVHEVRLRVHEHSGVWLEPELRMVGFGERG